MILFCPVKRIGVATDFANVYLDLLLGFDHLLFYYGDVKFLHRDHITHLHRSRVLCFMKPEKH